MQSVRVMLSYDYNHFETILSATDEATPKDMNKLRKEATQLCLEAIRQYKSVKSRTEEANSNRYRAAELSKEACDARRVPEGERTPAQKAVIKADDDLEFAYGHGYVDWDDDDPRYLD
jgi:DNA-directed RNA polymerase beta' subunit